MKKLEIIVGVIVIFGISLKIFNIPGGSMLMVLALMTLSIFYFVFGFAFLNGIKLRNIFKKESYKDTNAKKIIGAIGFGWGISLIIIGGNCKLQLWPGSIILLLTGLLFTGIIVLIANFFYFRNNAEYYKRIFKRFLIYGGLGLILHLIPATTVLNLHYGNNPYYTEHPDFEEHYKKMLADPYNSELRDELFQMGRELEQMKYEKWLQEHNDENR